MADPLIKNTNVRQTLDNIRGIAASILILTAASLIITIFSLGNGFITTAQAGTSCKWLGATAGGAIVVVGIASKFLNAHSKKRVQSVPVQESL